MADGHTIVKKTFHKPTYCHHCSDLLWGLIGQGYICEVCNFVVHERCVSSVITPCSGIAPCIIKNPVAHCWSEPIHHKRKFCTVCRKRLDETPAVHCLICEYYAHVECQDFALADCREIATYVPGKQPSTVKLPHHWREGNISPTLKCAKCNKSCGSSECLTGYRCEWCGITSHSGCRAYAPSECTFDVLQPIYLPPNAVSIPRTEVPMEAIIGVETKSKSTPLQRDYSCPELRTIGLCDATDSELSIRHLEINAREIKKNVKKAFLSPLQNKTKQSRKYYNNNNNNNTNNNSKTMHEMSSIESIKKLSDDGASSMGGSRSISNDGGSSVDETDVSLKRHRDIFLGITNYSDVNTSSISLTNSNIDISSNTSLINNNNNNNNINSNNNTNSNNNAIVQTSLKNRKKSSNKYNSAIARLKNESSTAVTRSKSFQEQGVQPLLRNARFFVNRHSRSNSDFCMDTISQNIEITIEDVDDCRQQQRKFQQNFFQQNLHYQDCFNLALMKSNKYTNDIFHQHSPPIHHDHYRHQHLHDPHHHHHHPHHQQQQQQYRFQEHDSTKDPKHCHHLHCQHHNIQQHSPHNQHSNNDNKTIRSGHILGRIFRRMRKISLGWRRSRCKIRRARSISEELSSGDAARYRDEDYASRPECSSSGGSHSKTSAAHKSDSKKGKEIEEKDEENIKVFDGNASLRRRIFRAIIVSRTCSLDHLLITALRAFHINRDPQSFYVTDLYAPGVEEVRLQDPHPIMSLHRIEGKRPAIFLRFRDSEIDKGFVRVYPGKLQLQIEEAFVNVAVDNNSTVNDLIRSALFQFGLHNHKAEDYRCSEVLLDRGVTERILCLNERPWEIVKQLGKDSIRQMELMRFYLQHKKDPHGPNIALFIGNLPQGLSQRNYEQIIIRYITEENRFSSIGPIYYEYGSVVIIFEDASKAVRSFYNLREIVIEDKKLQVLLLPNIEPSMISNGVQPLLVFVNVKSGGCQGLELISSFRKLLNPYQVFDLDNGGPLPGLYVFRHIQDYKILVCGGDGTIGWVLQCLDNVGQDSECSSPPCAIVPLGTGNDLARELRWGSGYTGGVDPLTLLRDVIDAEEIRLDRWTVVFHPEDRPEDAALRAPSNLTVTGAIQSEDNSQMLVMNNYFGIGVDADLCLDFHTARESNPNKFNSRFHNKGVYVKMGLRKMVSRKWIKELHKELKLEVDGKFVELPPVEGIIILNILNWGSGANPWGVEKDDQFSKPNHWDGMLEVVGVKGVVHLGQIQSKITTATRIAQGGHIKIHMNSDIPVQVDGEPWLQAAGDVVVFNSALKATMLKKGKSRRRPTEPHISPAVAGLASHNTPPENEDRDRDPLGS